MNATTTTRRTRKPASRCECGRVKSQYAHKCTKCARQATEAAKAEAQRHVERGTCPVCGTKLVYNNSIAGWWMCGAYACEEMRQAEFKGLPKCDFQCFTR